MRLTLAQNPQPTSTPRAMLWSYGLLSKRGVVDSAQAGAHSCIFYPSGVNFSFDGVLSSTHEALRLARQRLTLCSP